MARYDIFAGIETDNLNTVEYKRTLICEDGIEADYIASFLAMEDYERYAGEFGLLTWQQIRENLKNRGENYDDDIVDEYYLEEIEDKTIYLVQKIENNS